MILFVLCYLWMLSSLLQNACTVHMYQLQAIVNTGHYCLEQPTSKDLFNEVTEGGDIGLLAIQSSMTSSSLK